MPYEFMGADLETKVGQDDFLSAYAALIQAESDFVETFSQEWSNFLKECKDPTIIRDFVERILSNDEPEVRKLAYYTETLSEVDPPSAVRGLVSGLSDNDPENQKINRSFVGELLSGHQQTVYEQISLYGLAQIARAYSESKSTISA